MITDNDITKLKKVFVTKDEFKKSIHVLTEDIKTVIEMIGGVIQKLDNYHREHEENLDDHERRLDKVEDKVFSTI